MKFRVKIPGVGYLEFEKKPMSKGTRESLEMDMMFLSAIVSIRLTIWILR